MSPRPGARAGRHATSSERRPPHPARGAPHSARSAPHPARGALVWSGRGGARGRERSRLRPRPPRDETHVSQRVGVCSGQPAITPEARRTAARLTPASRASLHPRRIIRRKCSRRLLRNSGGTRSVGARDATRRGARTRRPADLTRHKECWSAGAGPTGRKRGRTLTRCGKTVEPRVGGPAA